METHTGTIVRLFPKEQFGFIRPENQTEGPDIFFHRIGLISPAEFNDLREGHQVNYFVRIDNKGKPRAIGLVVE